MRSRRDSPACWWIIRPICCANIYEKWSQMMQRASKRSFFKPWWKNGVISFFGAKTRTPISWFKQINASSKCCFAKSVRHPDETVTCEAGEVTDVLQGTKWQRIRGIPRGNKPVINMWLSHLTHIYEALLHLIALPGDDHLGVLCNMSKRHFLIK